LPADVRRVIGAKVVPLPIVTGPAIAVGPGIDARAIALPIALQRLLGVGAMKAGGGHRGIKRVA
jgi:hypothetical protein